MEEARPVLEMAGIGKAFAGHRVLENVELTLYPGQVHVLAGENGAGKSTLIKILSGVHTEYEGQIHLDGVPIRFASPRAATEAGIAVIYQELSVIPCLSVSDNIFLGRERCHAGGWMNFATQEEACAALMKELGLDIDPRRKVETYPLSIQQMIEIARALAFDARIIVMDEPTSALSRPEVRHLLRMVSDLKKRGCAIIYISHKMEEIYEVADVITILRDGRHISTTPAADLPQSELIRQMVGRSMDEQYPRRPVRAGRVCLEVKNFTVPDPSGLLRPCVQDVNFRLHEGEILGLGGLQGSGASELLHGLFGAYGAAVKGAVRLGDVPFHPRNPLQSIRKGLALLTNDRKNTGLVLSMGVTHNTTLASVPRYSPGYWMRHQREVRCAERHRQTFNTRCASLDQPVMYLSGGNQQKVALAKWIETGPRVLFLDEPTRGVDVGAKQEIYEQMNRWSEEGIAILLITSEMPELLALSDRILVMHRGEVTAEYKQEEATQENILEAAMGIKHHATQGSV